MKLIDRLNELHHAAITIDSGDDERRDSHENFEFIYALADAWPKLLAVINAATDYSEQSDAARLWFQDELMALDEASK